MARVLKTVKNEKEGIQAEITRNHSGGFTVGVRDLKSGIRRSESRAFTEWRDAELGAEILAAGK